MLLLSMAVIVVTLGTTLFLFVVYVTRIALRTPVIVTDCHAIMVPGMCLENNLPNNEFKRRLLRARALHDAGNYRLVILLGGVTGNNSLSEAIAGKQFLTAQGVSEAVIQLEQESNNTLENFRFARCLITEETSDVALVSSRYHLARCGVMANSLQIKHQLCSAESSFEWRPVNILLLLKEAFHLHWYFSGRFWATMTGNEKMLRRLQ